MRESAVYYPKILRGMIEICAEMGVGRETVLEWVDQGAPIAVEWKGRKPTYTSEAMALMLWRLSRSRPEEI